MTETSTASTAVRLRPLRARDLDRVIELERELFGSGAWTYGMLADELAGLGRWYVAAEPIRPDAAGPQPVVGYAGLWFDGEVTQVMTIGVDPAQQHLGIGSQLMDALIARSRELRAEAMLLEVRVDNRAALGMYAKYGFEQVRVRKRYYQPEDVDAYTMRLDLTGDRSRVLVTVAALRAELAIATGSGSRRSAPVVLDVRWALGRTDGRERYLAAHVPGAVYVDLETELAGPPTAEDGRHPLPDAKALESSARRWGICTDRPVVVYDGVGGMSAARAWWLLRWAGHRDVRILDGGIQAWEQAGLETERGEADPAPGDFEVHLGSLPMLDAQQAGEWAAASDAVLLDARAAERFRGETEPVDARAGHIPGAVSAPTADNLTAAGVFLDDAALRARFAALGVAVPAADAERRGGEHGQRVGLYCGSGVTAAHEAAALAAIGVEAALYPGSWSQWSADQSKPVAVGA